MAASGGVTLERRTWILLAALATTAGFVGGWFAASERPNLADYQRAIPVEREPALVPRSSTSGLPALTGHPVAEDPDVEPSARKPVPAIADATLAGSVTHDTQELVWLTEMRPDLALQLRVEQRLSVGQLVQACEELLRDVDTDRELRRRLEIDLVLPIHSPSRVAWLRTVLDRLRASVTETAEGQRASAEAQRALDTAAEVVASRVLRVAADADEFARIVSALGIRGHPFVREMLLQRLPALSWTYLVEMLGALKLTDPGRHDATVAAWIYSHPRQRESADRYLRSFARDQELVHELAVLDAGDMRRGAYAVERLVAAGRVAEARAVVEDIAQAGTVKDAFHSLRNLPIEAQDALSADLLDDGSITEWLRDEVNPRTLPDGVSERWQQRLARLRWAAMTRLPLDELHFRDVAGMAAWQSGRMEPAAETPGLLAQSSLFQASWTDADRTSHEAFEQITTAFRLGYREMAIGWMEWRVAAGRELAGAEWLAKEVAFLARMRRGVDPLCD